MDWALKNLDKCEEIAFMSKMYILQFFDTKKEEKIIKDVLDVYKKNVININTEKNIFLYWVGKEYNLILILRKLIYLHSNDGRNYKVHLINHDNIKDYLDSIPEFFYNFIPAHQADYARVNLIYKYGGIWLDSDTLVMDNLKSLFDIIEEKDGFFIKENNNVLSNGIFGSKKETSLMKEWKNKIDNILLSKKQHITWSEIGSEAIENIKKITPELYNNYTIFNGLDNMYSINWHNSVSEFIDKPYENYKNIIREYQPLIVLVHYVYKKLETFNESDILNGNMPINYFINKSIENFGIIKNKLFNNTSIFTYSNKDYISSSISNYKCWEPNITNIFNTIIN
jgi:mannosyltransferase OCH1-like enzyme